MEVRLWRVRLGLLATGKATGNWARLGRRVGGLSPLAAFFSFKQECGFGGAQNERCEWNTPATQFPLALKSLGSVTVAVGSSCRATVRLGRNGKPIWQASQSLVPSGGSAPTPFELELPRPLVQPFEQVIPLYVAIGAGLGVCAFQCGRHMFTTPDV